MDIELIIWGAGGHALVVADAIKRQGAATILGYLDEVHPDRKGSLYNGAAILGGTEALSSGSSSVAIGIGATQARRRIVETCDERNLHLVTVVHPQAVIADGVLLGEGTVVVAGAVINPAVKIGRGSIVNTCSSIDHGCSLGDLVHVCPGARLGGDVKVGDGAWIGIGAIIREGINIGPDATIGAGAVVIRDVPGGRTVVGNPARFLK